MIEAACTTCGGRFELDDSKAGHRGVCSRCGSEIEIPGDSLMVDLTPLELADDDFDDEPQSTVATDDGEPILLNLAADPANRGEAKRALAGSTTAPARTFWADVGLSFSLPLKGKGVLILIIATLVYCLAAMGAFVVGTLLYVMSVGRLVSVGRLAVVGGLAGGLIVGVLFAYWFKVIQATCAGDDELPPMTFDGCWDGVLVPLFQIAGTLAWTALPLGLWMLLATYRGPLLPGPGDSIVAISLATFALFMWPGTMLVVAINGFTFGALRYDLQLLTIVRNFTSYLTVFILLMTPASMTYGILYATRSLYGFSDLASSALVGVLMAVVKIYFSLVAMRIIGLFYRHNKHHFAWEAE